MIIYNNNGTKKQINKKCGVKRNCHVFSGFPVHLLTQFLRTMAGGALKLNAVVTSIYAQKPYNWVRTISSAAKAEALRCPAASTPRWRRRISFPAWVRGVPNYQIALGFHNREFSPRLPVRSISTTQMSSDPDKKEEQLPDSASSSAPTSQSDKLLTLPTILTIGRVVAVPLLVSSMFPWLYSFIFI